MCNLTELAGLLRELTKTAIPWVWGEVQEKAFQDTKAALSEDTSLVYFNPHRESELSVAASDLGAFLSQK